MSTAFQPTSFQSDAFQERGGVASGAITGSLSYTNNNDSFAGVANLGASQVTGGWPIYRPKKRKVVHEVVQQAEEQPTETVARLAAKIAIDKARRKDAQVVAELRTIYAEQDMLTMEIAALQQAINDDEEELILLMALAS